MARRLSPQRKLLLEWCFKYADTDKELTEQIDLIERTLSCLKIGWAEFKEMREQFYKALYKKEIL